MFYFRLKLIHVITIPTLLDNNITTLSTQNTFPKTCNRSAPRITSDPNFPTLQKPDLLQVAPSINSFNKINGTCFGIGTSFEVGVHFEVVTRFEVGTSFEDVPA